MRGGARPNSGPTKGTKYKPTIEKEMMRERLKELVAKHWDGLIESQIDKAKGIKIEALSRDGEIYYKDPGPDTFAAKILIEHSVGKPKEQIEMTGENGNPIELNVNIGKTIDKIYGGNKSG